jgi:signal transduction histidine kinase
MQASLDRHVSDIRKMNIEAERRNEELARISELAKESTRQKSLFIQNVSHQIRTPLNIIMGFSQVLKENKGAISADEAKGITDMMRHNAQMLDRMVLMLFDSSARGTTEEVYASRNDVVICNDLARVCIDATCEYFPDLSIQFVSDVPDDFSVNTNHNYLERSIRELLYNAAKYSDGQHITMRIVRTHDTVRFIVEDTGPGIAEEDVGRLFEMFTKVNDLSEGLGLGLALTKRHLQNLGGDINLDTSYKAGCRFIIELPIDK